MMNSKDVLYRSHIALRVSIEFSNERVVKANW